MSRDVVILRPEPGATRTARLVTASGLTPIILPLFKVVPTEWTAPDPANFDALLLTSTNALRCAGPQLRRFQHLPVLAVGPVTAKLARDLGLRVAATGQGGVSDLLRELPKAMRLLHLAGRNRIETISTQMPIERITVYRAAQIPHVDIGPAEGKVVLVHSPRAGERLSELVGDRRADIAIVAISEQAEAACGTGWRFIGHSRRPDDSAMVALAAELCDKSAEQ